MEPSTCYLFVDMNSFFASCEQQVNFYLRGRPVAVCVYTGKYGCIIAPSIEAKKSGVKTGMRLNEAVKLCPELIPIETHPARYREFHIKLMTVLRKYSEDVIPKSIDEAVINISNYGLVYKDPEVLARKIKEDITAEVGDWIKCSVGIAPNAFLAKLASDLQKPDGLVSIMPDNIDKVLEKLKLTDLPGIAKGMAARLYLAGITTPLQLRYAKPEHIKAACRSIVGLHWHHRLNFREVEVDTRNEPYKTMQAMRQVSAEQRRSPGVLNDILTTLCMTLEKRMVRKQLYCYNVAAYMRYENGQGWDQHTRLNMPLQDGMELLNTVKIMMAQFEKQNRSGSLVNSNVLSMCVTVYNFVPEDAIQYNLFESSIDVKKNKLRKSIYDIKDRFGSDKIMKAEEILDHPIQKDIIGFGSIKDM